MTTVAAVATFLQQGLSPRTLLITPTWLQTHSVVVATRTLKQVIHLFSAPLTMLIYALGTKHLFWHIVVCVSGDSVRVVLYTMNV